MTRDHKNISEATRAKLSASARARAAHLRGFLSPVIHHEITISAGPKAWVCYRATNRRDAACAFRRWVKISKWTAKRFNPLWPVGVPDTRYKHSVQLTKGSQYPVTWEPSQHERPAVGQRVTWTADGVQQESYIP